MLKFRNVTKKFGKIIAVQDVSFDVEEGEFVFVTGPSGAGKTTLLRMILREFKPDKGEIVIDGTDITELKSKEVPKLRQNIGTVFQDFKVLPEKTLRENVEIALAVIGLDKKEWDQRVDRVLDLVELTDREHLFPSQLSGGELQRVSLARALVVNPKIILADEPTGNLDWETAEKIMELLEKINSEGKTIIMATHHKVIVEGRDNRVIDIQKGKLSGEDNMLDKDVEKEESDKKDDDKSKEKEKKVKKDNKIKKDKDKKSESDNDKKE